MPYVITSGETTVRAYMDKYAAACVITEGDAISAASLGNAEIISNTLAGVDFRGNSFAPYASKSPYYATPTTPGLSHRYRMDTALKFSRLYGGDRARGGISVKYRDYAAYVLATRGSASVDLGGIDGRVLGNLEARTASLRAMGSEAVDWPLDSNMQPASFYSQGVYAAGAADIAQALNDGTARMAKREFMGELDETTDKVTAHIAGRISQRVIELDLRNVGKG